MFTADLLERAVKTFFQSFVATFGMTFIVPANVVDLSAWKAAGLAAVVASVSAGISGITSLLSKKVGTNKDTASIV